jgi:hypothetical protein
VFIDPEEEVLYDRDGVRAAVSIGGACGLYAFGCRFHSPVDGFGHAPSIAGELFSTRDAARAAAIRFLADGLPRDLGPHRHKIDILRAVLEGAQRQPRLF